MGQSGGRCRFRCRPGQFDIISGISFRIHHVQVFNFIIAEIIRVKAESFWWRGMRQWHEDRALSRDFSSSH